MISPPESVSTLIDLLAYRAQVSATKVAYTYLDESRTYSQLWQDINEFGHYLLSIGLTRQTPVVLALPNGHQFFTTFYGIQRAGGIAVPVFPGYSPDRILSRTRLCGAKIIILPGDTPAGQIDALQQLVAGDQIRVITVADTLMDVDSTATSRSVTTEVPTGKAVSRLLFPTVTAADIAFIQYTSGSTGNPKGVVLSQQNLLTNVQQMIAGMEITAADIFVSWLPVYHDMGLILKTMVPFYLAAELHLLPTSLANIQLWLDTIQKRRGTFTAAPDFAYRLAVRRLQADHRYDLSSLRVVLNAAEPVRAGTIEAFENRFDLHNVMVAGYGLAEATVGVSMERPGRPPTVDARGFVSVGPPFPQVDIIIVKGGEPAPVGEIGEIAVCSPANSRGYFQNPTATAALYWPDSHLLHEPDGGEARQVAAGSYILTGDLGYLDTVGHLTIVGRKKSIIIHTGHTVYPAEIEELVNALPQVRFAAAIGIDRGRVEGEQVFIFAEVRRQRSQGAASGPVDWQPLVIEIVQRFHQRFGFRPGRVYLVKPKTIPRTYNGKLQHQKLKQAFLQGELQAKGRILFS